MSRQELGFALAGLGGAAFIRALFATVRMRVEGAGPVREFRERGQPVVLVLWHGQMLPLIHLHRNQGITVLVSEHRDGEYIARVLHRLGLKTARGSSTRGGSRGLRELLRAAQGGGDLALTPDGPRGPRHSFKEGALLPARIHGLPVVPLAMAASRARVLGSWDGFTIPAPFSTVQVAYGTPVRIPREADDQALARHARELGAELDRLTLWCRRALGLPDDGAGPAAEVGERAGFGEGARPGREDA